MIVERFHMNLLDMKQIFKAVLFVLAVVLLDQCEMEEPYSNNIPDKNFLHALIERGVDTDGDGKINPAEAETITSLNVSKDSISDMTGLKLFINLVSLDCDYNKITKLDVSNNLALKRLSCHHNKLTTLDVSNNTALTYLNCRYNQLTTLNVSNNTVLKLLDCSGNKLKILDVSNSADLIDLRCSSNSLTNLDVTKNIFLKYLFCNINYLTSLDLSKNISLKYLYCFSNKLPRLDISKNTALEFLNCGGNQLTNLDISHNIAIGSFPHYLEGMLSYPIKLPDLDLSDMPTLFEVCVWEMPFPPMGVYVDTTSSPNIYFTTDCSK